MLDLTPEEKKVLLFIFSAVLFGSALNAIIKSFPPAKAVFSPEPRLARINLNTVTLNELLDTRCVPEKLAGRIIAYRNSQGGFGALEELEMVKGVGRRRYEKLKELFYIE